MMSAHRGREVYDKWSPSKIVKLRGGLQSDQLTDTHHTALLGGALEVFTYDRTVAIVFITQRSHSFTRLAWQPFVKVRPCHNIRQ